ncbi:hypothetical protein IC582_017587 [Cucumis melo]|uniref:Gamma-glutamyl peptidase 5-like isoform X2 n=1 Tax=Cucumis melo TaxID=3656 RepID=A0A1S3BYN3_CUCME|nr:gamma-glutamyl peptidase 5-like isoform X2 [Cucumis melo]
MGMKRFALLLCADDSEYVKMKYGGYFGVFVRMLGEEGEAWDRFRVAAGEFPADDQIADYDGFVISGSCNDAHGDDPWICRLIALLQRLASLNKRILGICFGHQIYELPSEAEVIGQSDKYGIEMFKYRDHILGIQGHPEYTKDILLHLIDRLVLRELITDEFAEEMRSNLEEGEADREAWKRLCINFLKGGL